MARLPPPPTGPREAASQRSRAMVMMIKSTCSQHRGKLCSGMMRISTVAMPSSVAGLESANIEAAVLRDDANRSGCHAEFGRRLDYLGPFCALHAPFFAGVFRAFSDPFSEKPIDDVVLAYVKTTRPADHSLARRHCPLPTAILALWRRQRY